jgi:hypothetical protein
MADNTLVPTSTLTPSPAPESSGITVTSGPASGSTATTTQGINQLAKDRIAYFESELKDPQLLDRLEYLFFHQENKTKKVECGAIIFETAVNRAYFLNKTLKQIVFTAAYYAHNGMSTRPHTELTKEMIRRVIYNGQNETDLATDNASNEKGNPVAGKRVRAGCTGSWFNLKTGQKITEPAEVTRLTDANDGSKEFLYRADGGGGYATAAGLKAAKYAKKYNIQSTSPSIFEAGKSLPEELVKARSSPLTGKEVGNIEPPAIVNNTDPHGPTVIKNTNDMPKGMFVFPGVGAMVWVFFREGNPLYPVYFAASYSSNEWEGAYHGSSLNPEGTNNGTVDSQVASSLKLNPNAGGGLEFTHVKDASDPSGAHDKAVAMIYGDDGSNMMFSKGYHQIYTRHDRRDQIDGHLYNIINGAEEKWVEDDSSTNMRGNVTIKIGKVDAEAMEVMKELSDFSKQMNDTLMSNSSK